MKKCVSVPILVLAIGLFVSFGAISLTHAQSKKSDARALPVGSEILVQVGPKKITKKEFEARIKTLPPQYQANLKDEKARKDFMEILVQTQLFALAAKEEKIDENELVAIKIEDAINGVLAQEYVRMKLSGVEKVTDAEIKKYYDENEAQLIKPTAVNVQHILIELKRDAKPEEDKAALAKAEKLKKELDAGADFSELAKAHSDDSGSKESGGDLGYFSEAQMVPEFSGPIFKMKVGEISRPFKTSLGYHIVKLNDRQEGMIMDLKEATPRIESTLMREKHNNVLEKDLEHLKKKYQVTFLSDKI
ncbi:MAG: peptidylprolyl isomerase [Deltaproteobacteria bacterium]|nr:peptidylprolyl isomerase [Deltaproteobacteria bacterium]